MEWKQLFEEVNWTGLAGWILKVSASVVAIGAVAFPLQVKYEDPESSMKEIYLVLWDCIMDMVVRPPAKISHQVISTDELEELINKSKSGNVHQEPHSGSNNAAAAADSSRPLVVDTRPEAHFRRGHIDGAVLLTFNKFRDDFQQLPKHRPIVVACAFGHYSVVACNKLTQAGYTRVYDYAEGMEEWINRKKPIAKGISERNFITTTDCLEASDLSSSNAKKSDAGAFLQANTTSVVKTPIYMDYNATTPLDPRVLEVMMPYLTHKFGNAASLAHSFGTDAERAVYQARRHIAAVIGASSSSPEDEIVFTSGASESNNLAIKGVAQYCINNSKTNGSKTHIITCMTEHKAVLDPCKVLESQGFEVTYLPVNKDGLIDMNELTQAIKPTTILLSIMLANNEIGVIQPYREIGALCRKNNIIFHTDGTQGVGKIPLNVVQDNIDLMSISGHKIYGPKGVGALYVRPGIKLSSQIDGGGHESGMRSGTLNVPGIVGLGECCRLVEATRVEETRRIQILRDRLLTKISEKIPNHQVNGSMIHRLVGNLHMSFAKVSSEQVLMELAKDVAISSGSACNSRSTGPSHVVTALGISAEYIGCTLRFGIGRFTSQAEVDYVADRLAAVIQDCRQKNTDKIGF